MRISHFILGMVVAAGFASASPSAFLKKPPEWFRSQEGAQVVSTVLSWQSTAGGWPKNVKVTAEYYQGDRAELKGTFDNNATTDPLRLLARHIEAGGPVDCREAFQRGLDHILEAQYENGGFPQFHPPGKGYARNITLNDHAMVRLLEFLREAAGYAFLDAARRERVEAAFARGVECILRCQIDIDGKLTVWCAQHDPETLAPAMARSYELPSLSGAESARILVFLMSLEDPAPEVVRAVEAGVAWFDRAKLTGIRIESTGGERRVVEDPDAEPLWARFYDLDTGRPFFCDRDGVKKASLSEIGSERRNGYAWYGGWGRAVSEAHARWQRR
jgi:PelA/Pel-15E family pectate lyase